MRDYYDPSDTLDPQHPDYLAMGAYPAPEGCTCGTPDTRLGHEPGCDLEDRRITLFDRERALDGVMFEHERFEDRCRVCRSHHPCRRYRLAEAMLQKLGLEWEMPF